MKSHNRAVGPDEIRYGFLKQLPSCSVDFLLQAFNEVWVSGKFPTSWKKATIIPIPKPGKDITDPSNYRPIALTSCLCKTLERMINTRFIMHTFIHIFYFNHLGESAMLCGQTVPEAIHNQVAIKLMKSGLLT